MDWYKRLSDETLPWLLDHDTPGVRYLALHDLMDRSSDDPDLVAAETEAYRSGPIASILAGMDAAGYWVEPGSGYYPKYRGTVWSIITLAQLGAKAEKDERISKACAYLIDQALTGGGQFSVNGAPSGTADCLQGNLCAAFLDLGCEDPRLDSAFDWMARSVTGEGIAPLSDRQAAVRYYAGKCGPLFACGSNNKLSCAWGAAKVMLAFSKLPLERRTPVIKRAIAQGIDFLFSVDPATAAYPCGFSDKPSGNWWKFGFPVFYITDLLQIVEALVGLGYGDDPRLANAWEIIRQKQDARSRWLLEYDYAGKIWTNFGAKKQANPWVTMRVMRAVKRSGWMN